jgi:hypothetical protein
MWPGGTAVGECPFRAELCPPHRAGLRPLGLHFRRSRWRSATAALCRAPAGRCPVPRVTCEQHARIAQSRLTEREKGLEAQPLRGRKEGYRTGPRPSLDRLCSFRPSRRLSTRARCAGCDGLQANRLCGPDFFLRRETKCSREGSARYALQETLRGLRALRDRRFFRSLRSPSASNPFFFLYL